MFKEIRKADVLLFAFFILSALLLFGRSIVNASEGEQVEIRIAGEPYGVYSLWEDRTIILEQEDARNEVRIEGGTVWMEESDCKNQLCVRQGPISRSGESIVCLPHRVTVEITGRREEGIDAVAR